MYQILLNKISHRFLLTTKQITGCKSLIILLSFYCSATVKSVQGFSAQSSFNNEVRGFIRGHIQVIHPLQICD
jgi:hypothetical protein